MANLQISGLGTNPSPAMTDVEATDNSSLQTFKNTRQAALNLFNSNNYGSNAQTFGSNLALSNRLNTWNLLTASTTGLKAALPAMNTTSSYPVGKVFFIVNSGTNAFGVYCQDNTTAIVSSLLGGQVLMMQVNSNSTANGAFTYQVLGSIASQQANNVTILGGGVSNVTMSGATIDDSVIGSSIPEAGAFTTLQSNLDLIGVVNGTISTINAGSACSASGYSSPSGYAQVQLYANGSQMPLGIAAANIAASTIGTLITQGYTTTTLGSSGIAAGTIIYFAEDGSGGLTTSSGHWIAGVVLNNIATTSYNAYLSIALNPVGLSSATTATTFNNKNQGVRLGDQVDFTNTNPKTVTLDGSAYAANGTFYWYLTNSGSGALTLAAAAGNTIYGPTTIPGGNGQYQTAAVTCRLFNINSVSTWYIEVANGFNLVAGTNMSFSFGSNGITLNSTGAAGITNVNQNSSAVTMAPNTRYVTNNGATLVTYSFPAGAAIGDTYYVVGASSGGWKTSQSLGMQCVMGTSTTTLGTGGSIASTNPTDECVFTCIGTNTFSAYSSQGNLTVT